ncbi:MAG: YdeI/OmpD-associated family protein [Ferruginibacter sp.]
MISFTTTILKFDRQGEKTGWTYITIPVKIAEQLRPGNKKSFRVKGRLDEHTINGVALLPMGGGDFIMALNAGLRRAIGKRKGAMLKVQLAVDEIPYQVNAAFTECMEDEPAALQFFKSLPLAHQNYFSKWIESAKTEPTKVKRIARAVSALAHKMGFPEMLKSKQGENEGPLPVSYE